MHGENMQEETRRRVMFGNGERDYSVDMMRSISCFMVVLTHTSLFLILTGPYDAPDGVSSDWLSLSFIRCLTVAATNLFLMISGIFFLSPERNVSISKIWSKNILKLSLAYIVWSMIYALLRIFYVNPEPFTWKTFCTEALVQEFHLWYIPMMIGIYVLVPFMRFFTAHAERKHYLYMIALMIGAIALNSLSEFNGVYEYHYSESIVTMISRTPVKYLCRYPFYCILGYYLYTYRPKLKTRICLYILGIAGVIFSLWCTTFLYVETGNPNETVLIGKFSIGILAKNTALFVFVITVFSRIKMSSGFKKLLSKISAATLFIYLSHVVLMRIFLQEEWLFDTSMSIPLISIVWAVVIYFVLFLVSLLFLQMIPWARMRNCVLDAVWPNRRIWNGGRKK